MEKREKRMVLPMPGSIHEAAQRAACRMVLSRLIDKDGIDRTDDDSRTALHHACATGRHGVARFLLERGSDPNLADTAGWTALHLACLIGKKPLVGLLLSSGANPGARNLLGDTPADLTDNGLIKAMLDRALRRSDARGTRLPTRGAMDAGQNHSRAGC